MRIIVYYIYQYQYPYGRKELQKKIFTDRVKALRFIKMVDGDKFPGRINSWECDCEWDNEWLYARHVIGRKELL